jgi:hypothetical protein
MRRRQVIIMRFQPVMSSQRTEPHVAILISSLGYKSPQRNIEHCAYHLGICVCVCVCVKER